MNDNTIICETTEEHSHPTPVSTSIITSSPHVDSVSTTAGETKPQPIYQMMDNTCPIQGVSGAQYAPLNTSPTPQPDTTSKLDKLLLVLATTLEEIIGEMNAKSSLEQAVDTALEQAQWFKDLIEDTCADRVQDMDFDYEIGNNIERYFRNSFDPSDHYDFDDAVRARVEDEVESIIDGLVEEAVESRLADLVEEKLKNASITINF